LPAGICPTKSSPSAVSTWLPRTWPTAA